MRKPGSGEFRMPPMSREVSAEAVSLYVEREVPAKVSSPEELKKVLHDLNVRLKEVDRQVSGRQDQELAGIHEKRELCDFSVVVEGGEREADDLYFKVEAIATDGEDWDFYIVTCGDDETEQWLDEHQISVTEGLIS